MSNYILPLIIVFILFYGLTKGVDIFSAFTTGAKKGVSTAVGLIPSLALLMTCVGMFKASGGLDALTALLSPAAAALHIPKEIIPLGIIRPLSGSGGLVLFENIISNHGADSITGKVASVLMGASETTFYTMSVYYGAAKVRKQRHTLVSALSGDLTAFIMSSVAVFFLFQL